MAKMCLKHDGLCVVRFVDILNKGVQCASHAYSQLRAKLNCEGCSSTRSSGRLSRGASVSHLMTHV